MAATCARTERAALADLADEAPRSCCAADPEVERDPRSSSTRVIEIDLSTLEPHLVGPHTPDLARPISRDRRRRSRRSGYPDEISVALIGSCTNSSYEDISRAADVVRQATAHGREGEVPLLVTPGSEQIRATIERDGQMDGAARRSARRCSRTPAARASASGSATTSATGEAEHDRHLVQPQLPARATTATRDAGVHRQPGDRGGLRARGHARRSTRCDDELERGRRQDVQARGPRAGARAAREGLRRELRRATWRPPADGAASSVEVAPDSERLQLLDAVRAVGRQGLLDAARCCSRRRASARPTTSPPPARGCASAATSTTSPTTCSSARSTRSPARPATASTLSPARGEPLSEVARDYKARGLRWVVVGDENYGEGSSREHAAMSPRFLGAARDHRAVASRASTSPT